MIEKLSTKRLRSKAAAKDVVYRVVIRLILGVFRALGLRFTVAGAEHIPRSGGAVLASNHVSYLDFAFCGLAARPARRFVRFMAKQSTFTNRISGPWMRGMKHIPVNRAAGASAYAAALTALRNGEIVGVFPEATISRSFMLKEFKGGVVRMAADADVPIIPMVTWGGQRVFTVDRRYSLRRGKTISLLIGEPITRRPGERLRDMLTRLIEAMTELLDTAQRSYPDRPSGPDDTWWVPAHLGGTAPTPAQVAAEVASAAERGKPDSGQARTTKASTRMSPPSRP
jgi:1-acyl-sn-glycerol-3-phosphate acyltransferase